MHHLEQDCEFDYKKFVLDILYNGQEPIELEGVSERRMSVSDRLRSTVSFDLLADLLGIHRGASMIEPSEYQAQTDRGYHLHDDAAECDAMTKEIAWLLAIGVNLSRCHSTENTQRRDRC